MFGTFSESAIAALGRAQDVAVGRGSTEIAARDVALAVLRQLRSPVDPSLSALATHAELDTAAGSPAADDPAQLGRLRRSAFADRIPGQRLPFAESAIATFRGAWKKATWDGRKSVDEFDLLTAAIEQPALSVARTAAGTDLDAARGIIRDLRQPAAR